MPPFSHPQAHIFLPPLHHLLPARTVSLHFLISPHLPPTPTPPPAHVFILFCGELCYDKDFTPRMYVLCACVVPLWGSGALMSNAGRCFPGREEGPRAEGGGRRVLPTPCPACWWENFPRAEKTPELTYSLRKKVKGFWFFFFFGCRRNLQQQNQGAESLNGPGGWDSHLV